MAKFCGKCGNRLDEATGLCPNCDAEKIKELVEKPTKQTNESEKQSEISQPKEVPLSKKEASTKRKADKKAAKKERKAQRKTAKKAKKKEKWAAKTFGQKIGSVFLRAFSWLLLLCVLFSSTICVLVGWGVVEIPFISSLLNKFEFLLPQKDDHPIAEIYIPALKSLTPGETCFLIGDKTQICFEVTTVNCNPERVYLCESTTNSSVEIMKDDGKNGDRLAGDNIYTCILDVKKTDVGTLSYYAETDDKLTSEQAMLYFFRRPTDDDRTTIDGFKKNISSIEASFKSTDGLISETVRGDVLKDVENFAKSMYEQGKLMYYEVNATSIVFKFLNGYSYIYVPPIDGVDNVGHNSNITVVTLQPCLETYPDNLSELMKLTDKAAERVSETVPNYTFDGTNFDNSNVSLDKIKSFKPNQLVLWHGHGGHSSSLHSYLLTGEKFDWNAWMWNWDYYMDSVQNRIVECSGGTVAITSKYIDKYCGDLSNSMFYLAACQSGKDSVLADSLLNKGAIAVVANSETIYTVYNMQMQNATISNMTTVSEATGDYMTLQEALTTAKEEYGNDDEEYGDKAEVATPLVFGGKTANEFQLARIAKELSAERDIVLVLDISGSMSGTPMAETKKASVNFIETIVDEDAGIGIVTYDNSATMLSDFSENETALITAVSSIFDGGGTNIESGLAQARSMLNTSNAKKKIIVLMSDGEPNDGKEGDDLIAYADDIKDDGIIIYTLGFFESLGSHKSFAQILMEGIASDGCHYEVARADDLVFFFEDVADQINGQKYIYIRIACPVDVTVTHKGETLCSAEDDLNVRTDFGTLTFEDNENITNANEDDRIKVLRLKEGADYDIQITGTGHGLMDYTIGFMDENGDYSDFRRFEDVKITRRTTIDTVAAVSKTSVLNIDENGDGKYDLKLRAEENGYGEEVDDFLVVYAAIAGGVFLLLVIVARIARNNRKKKKVKENQ